MPFPDRSSLRVAELYQYPVKSLPGIAVTVLPLDDFGPAGDRRWMIVDADGQFVTQRTEPRLALVRVVLVDDGIELTLPNGLAFGLQPGPEPMAVSVWGEPVEGLKASGSASASLSAWLGRALVFIYMADDRIRPVDPDYVSGRRVSFADGYPFLITTPASLSAVDQWTGQTWDMRRFRPGIVIAGGEAFAEDRWRWMRIGDAVLECVKPCSRCVMTTVDPDTGERHAGQEPLRTLSRHRRTAAGVIFGQNAVHWRGSSIAVGDAVELLDGSPL